jgi:hypothetical protein
MAAKKKATPTTPVSRYAGEKMVKVQAVEDGYWDNVYYAAQGPVGPSVFMMPESEVAKTSWVERADKGAELYTGVPGDQPPVDQETGRQQF